jgi:hypothetical protein
MTNEILPCALDGFLDRFQNKQNRRSARAIYFLIRKVAGQRESGAQ